MSPPIDERSKLYVFWVKDGAGARAACIIDGRRYADGEQVRSAVADASRELRRRELLWETRTSLVRADEPAPTLPSWEEYRQEIRDDLGSGS